MQCVAVICEDFRSVLTRWVDEIVDGCQVVLDDSDLVSTDFFPLQMVGSLHFGVAR